MTNQLTNSMEQSPSREAKEYAQIVKKFPAFYGIRRFITVFTRAWTPRKNNPTSHVSSYKLI
jgi:hypothetical protein